MGHVNLAKMKFPEGTRGPALDVMTRAPLWELGLQFNHGTGKVLENFNYLIKK